MIGINRNDVESRLCCVIFLTFSVLLTGTWQTPAVSRSAEPAKLDKPVFIRALRIWILRGKSATESWEVRSETNLVARGVEKEDTGIAALLGSGETTYRYRFENIFDCPHGKGLKSGSNIDGSTACRAEGTIVRDHVRLAVTAPKEMSTTYRDFSQCPEMPTKTEMRTMSLGSIICEGDLANGRYVSDSTDKSGAREIVIIEKLPCYPISPELLEIMNKAVSWHIVWHEHTPPICHLTPPGNPYCDPSCAGFCADLYRPLGLSDKLFQEAVIQWSGFCGFDQAGATSVHCLHWVPKLPKD